MFNLFKSQPKLTFTLLARYRTGDWFRQFTVSGVNAYQAARDFDQSELGEHWTRVSGATLKSEA